MKICYCIIPIALLAVGCKVSEPTLSESVDKYLAKVVAVSDSGGTGEEEVGRDHEAILVMIERNPIAARQLLLDRAAKSRHRMEQFACLFLIAESSAIELSNEDALSLREIKPLDEDCEAILKKLLKRASGISR